MTTRQTVLLLAGLGGAAAGGYLLWQRYRQQQTGGAASRGTGGSASPAGGGARANAAGGTVTLTITPTAGLTVGQPITLTAQASGISDPLYEFWVLPPGGASASECPTAPLHNGWCQLLWPAGYTPQNVLQFTPAQAGWYQVIVYARSASAPTHESAAQRAVYEANSDTWYVNVAA